MEQLWQIYHPTVPEFLSCMAQTPPMQRLRSVGMNCGCEYTSFERFAHGKAYSRYVHSMGVALIVWHFASDRKQSVAGLFHDISTPVFAHVVDFLRGDYLKQESTEDGTERAIASSEEIQRLIREYGLTTEQVCDYHRYPIADNDSPGLSADRLEYTIGNALNFGFLTTDQIRAIYSDLTVGTNESGQPELCFRHADPALAFAETALRCSKVYVSDEDRYSMQILSELLADAIRLGILSEKDLETTEPAVIGKIDRSQLKDAWERFRNLHRIVSAPLPAVPEGAWRKINAKKRYIDPLAEGMGRVSAISSDFCATLTEYLQTPLDAWLLGE